MICEDENRPYYPRQTTIRTFVCAAILFLNNQNNKSIDFLNDTECVVALSRWIFFSFVHGEQTCMASSFPITAKTSRSTQVLIMNGERRFIKGFHVFFACCNVVQNGKVNYEVLMSRWKKYAKIDLGKISLFGPSNGKIEMAQWRTPY